MTWSAYLHMLLLSLLFGGTVYAAVKRWAAPAGMFATTLAWLICLTIEAASRS